MRTSGLTGPGGDLGAEARVVTTQGWGGREEGSELRSTRVRGRKKMGARRDGRVHSWNAAGSSRK